MGLPPAAPPAPAETEALAATGEDINRGNSNQDPLSPQGEAQAQEVAAGLAQKGGLDTLKASTSKRSADTAQAIAEQNPTPVDPEPDPNSESWAQGNMEGQPTAMVKDQIRDLVRKNPTFKIPGQGAMSTRPGESFDDFRQRYLSSIRGTMQQLADNPSAKHGIVTHSTGIKLLNGWLANDTPDDLSIKPEAMDDKSEAPGNVSHLFPDKDGKWQIKPVDLKSSEPLPPGIFLIRHGATPWNAETYAKNEGGQDARQQITKYLKGMDFGRARAVAQKASVAGHLSDDDISSLIDSSLPDAKTAADLPLHHLLGVASAASPAKRQEYAPVIQKHFAGASQLPPDAAQQLTQHLRAIGFGPQNSDQGSPS